MACIAPAGRWFLGGWIALVATPALADVVDPQYPTTPITGSLVNPAHGDFALAKGSLSLTSGGSVTLNTDTGAISGLPTGLSLEHNYYSIQSTSGRVELGLFVFDAIDLPQGVNLTVTGNRGLVLASRGDFNFGTTLDLGGRPAPDALSKAIGGPGTGAPGAEGGNPVGGVTSSRPPSSSAGDGGRGGYGISANTRGQNGVGAGAGRVGSFSPGLTSSAGGGAAYGGAGGASASGSALGGDAYGDAPLTDLFGGSGGGGAHQNTNNSTAPTAIMGGGGGGGGAIEFVSLGTLTLSGSILATGGQGGGSSVATGPRLAGGGGAGGGVLVAANDIVFSGTVNASGGASGSLNTSQSSTGVAQGGGGGGGRVAFYYNTITGSPTLGTTIKVTGGQSGGPLTFQGADGSFYNAGAGSFPFRPVASPELSSLTLAVFGAAPVLLRRRRRG